MTLLNNDYNRLRVIKIILFLLFASLLTTLLFVLAGKYYAKKEDASVRSKVSVCKPAK
jgi:hypothetical protein